MIAWLPRFACPECGEALEGRAPQELVCGACGGRYSERDGIWDFLADGRRARLDAFVQQYRLVREREGRRPDSARYYQNLPAVESDDPHACDWCVRRETYRHLLRHVLAAGPQPSTILDLGAGSGWLSHRLSTLGHRVVAVDALDDAVDGLGAIRHYPTAIVAVRADFDALPLVPGQFDVVVFNGSLHYSPDVATSLKRAQSMLAAGGTVAVMDSPMFRTDRDGAAMVADKLRQFADDYGVDDAVQPGCGYLTFASLAAQAGALQMHSDFVHTRGPLRWRLQRQLNGVRLGRQPATFGLWVAR
jgi:2-polyprenyl-3-methyl-5-hydroxy-6-metoxy-1,4-benzoquinol methylase